jgi:Protein of unknown function (DUF2442)
VGMGRALPDTDVTAVQVLGHYNLRVTFADGLTGDVDVSDLAALDGDLIRPLHDPDYFARVRVDPGLGTVVWPNGTDLAPERLHDEAAEHPVSEPGSAGDQRENIRTLVSVLMDNAATILKVVGRVLDRAGDTVREHARH